MAQHVICRSLSSGRGGEGGGRQKLPGGGISYAMGGGGGGGAAAPPPKAMLDPGLACKIKRLKSVVHTSWCMVKSIFLLMVL